MSTSNQLQSYTPSTLHRAMSQAMRGRFPNQVFLQGIVTGWRVLTGDYVVFSLGEEGPDKTRVSCIIPTPSWRSINKHLDQIDLPDGTAIQVKGQPSIHKGSGILRFMVRGVHSVQLPREIIRKRILDTLSSEGGLGRNRKQRLSQPPLALVLIAPHDSAGYADFCSELSKSGLAFSVKYIHCPMNGPQSGPLLAQAIGASRRLPAQAVVICRGGGDRTSLAGFDSLEAARSVCLCSTPVITGIGHQSDITLVDEMAFHSAITPTAAASFLVERVQRFMAGIDKTGRLICQVRGFDICRDSLHDIKTVAGSLEPTAQDTLRNSFRENNERKMSLENLGLRLQPMKENLDRTCAGILRSVRSELNFTQPQLDLVKSKSRQRLQAGLDDLDCLPVGTHRVKSSLQKENTQLELGWVNQLGPRSKTVLAFHLQHLQSGSRQVKVSQPSLLLKRGLIIARGEDGRIIKDAARVAPGQRLQLHFRDGNTCCIAQ